MKRCPECRRDYTDETLNFCLDDGTALLDGPVSDEDVLTAILQVSGSPSGMGPDITESNPKAAFSRRSANKLFTVSRLGIWITLALAIAVIAVFFGYRYLASTRKIDSIAVLPFVNASGNDDVEYLSDGITESLINSLSRLPNLSVKARSFVFRYKGKDINPQQVGSELSVRAILNGRIVNRGDQLTISVDLVNASTGDQMWGQQYSGKPADAVSLQAQIANDVSRRLQSDLSREDQDKLNKGSTTDPEAYLLYLKGRYQTAKYTKDGLERGLGYFNQAIELDPQYALAYYGVAENYIAACDWFIQTSDAAPKAAAASEKALHFDPELAAAHGSLGVVRWWFDWDAPAAEAELKRAIELDPNDGKTRSLYGWFLIATGRLEAGVAESKRAAALDPLSVEVITIAASNLYFARRYDEAVEMLRGALEIDKNYWLAHDFLGRCFEAQEKLTDAISEFKLAIDLEKDVPENYSMLAHAYGIAGKRKEAEAVLQRLRDMANDRHVPAYNLAIAYAGVGETEQAFANLERTYAERSFYMTWLSYDPQLDPLRNDPRFEALVKRVKFPE